MEADGTREEGGTTDKWATVRLPFDLPVGLFPRLDRDKRKGDFESFKALASMWGGCRAEGTMKSYKTMVNKMTVFFTGKDYIWENLCEFYVEDFVKSLHSSGASYSTWGTVTGVLQLLQKMSERELLTDPVKEMIEGGKRIAAKQREPVRKMRPIGREVIEKAVRQFVIPYMDDPTKINHCHFRTIFRWVIYHESLCRFDDFAKLRAKHFKIYKEEVEIFFPSRKND